MPQARVRRLIMAIGAGVLGGGTLISSGALVVDGGARAQAQAPAARLVPFVVEGDAIRSPLTAEPGNIQRGRSIAVNTNEGACVLCHAVPEPSQRFMGNAAPSLAGVGARLTAAQIRLRIVDATRVNPNSPMPAYYRIEGLNRVAQAYRGKPILNAQQVEDLVAWLSSLTSPPAKGAAQ